MTIYNVYLWYNKWPCHSCGDEGSFQFFLIEIIPLCWSVLRVLAGLYFYNIRANHIPITVQPGTRHCIMLLSLELSWNHKAPIRPTNLSDNQLGIAAVTSSSAHTQITHCNHTDSWESTIYKWPHKWPQGAEKQLK